jgi:hypothetical protein
MKRLSNSSPVVRQMLSFTLLIALVVAVSPQRASAVIYPVPAQFIGKMYTEALGRAPDYPGWVAYTNKFATEGCTTAKLREVAYTFYTTDEYYARGYDNETRLLTLYRGALNREIDAAGRNTWLDQLEPPPPPLTIPPTPPTPATPWEQVLTSILNSSEFTSLTSKICQPGPYSFGGLPGVGDVIAPKTVGAGNVPTTAAALNAALQTKANQGGGEYVLAQKLVIRAEGPIIVPPNVTLTTSGILTSTQYAKMARIVRERTFRDGALVILHASGHIKGLWIDGRRAFVGYDARYHGHEPNIDVAGGNASVEISRVSDATGWTHIFMGRNVACTAVSPAVIKNNLITDYAGVHGDGVSDGITVPCGETLVQGNTVVDVTDVGIILFAVGTVDLTTTPNLYTGSAQKSQVTSNTVVQVGNSANSGLAIETVPCTIADPNDSTKQIQVPCPAGTPYANFYGMAMNANILWTDTSAPAYKVSQQLRSSPHFDIAMAIGTRPYWGDASPSSVGGQWTANNTGGFKMNTNNAFAVSGAFRVNVMNNAFNVTSYGPFDACPPGAITGSSESETNPLAGSTIQPHMVNDTIRSKCINLSH